MDFKALGKFEQGALVAGGVSLILSFFDRYLRISFDTGISGIGGTFGSNAWTSYATLGMLLIVAATAVVAVKAFAATSLPDGVPWNLVAFATATLGTILIVLRAITAGDGVGPGWSGYLLFLSTIALSVMTFLSFRASGEKVPEIKKDTPPAA
ncbi:hypothetical protein HMPREF0063_10948 [Aeromicrobium marinum DSM 15272]|uniref:Uncharacterized protein n=1 Tax=Aeromicrobium marinum DSM 15272 TaxID=585531 RepID=E2SAF8_9ACTN|nr:hypothetical protein [Aeromicrobium marinum]EFQ84232.1 hypothetical protein HMPREF0063_10948 [Aeromicrobium marinum DSM 15272]